MFRYFQRSEPPITGRILEILQDANSVRSFVLLDQFQVRSTRHEFFGVPVLGRRLNETTLLIVQSKVRDLSSFILTPCTHSFPLTGHHVCI